MRILSHIIVIQDIMQMPYLWQIGMLFMWYRLHISRLLRFYAWRCGACCILRIWCVSDFLRDRRGNLARVSGVKTPRPLSITLIKFSGLAASKGIKFASWRDCNFALFRWYKSWRLKWACFFMGAPGSIRRYDSAFQSFIKKWHELAWCPAMPQELHIPLNVFP